MLHYQSPNVLHKLPVLLSQREILTANKSAIVPATLFKAVDPATPIRKQNIMSIGRLYASAVPIFNTAYKNTNKGGQWKLWVHPGAFHT